MEFIISLIKTLSVISVVLAALWLLIPKGSTAALLKYAMGIFTLAVIISAFTTLPKLSGGGEVSLSAEAGAVTTAENIDIATTRYLIEQLLTDNNIKFKEVEIITDISGESGIDITKAVIQLVYEEELDKAAGIIKAETGITAVGG